MTSWWAYAIVDRAPAALGRGIDGEDLRALDEDGFAIVVGVIDRAPDASLESLRAHDDVVRAIARAAPATLPIRFGARASSEDALRTSLRPRAAVIREGLDRVRDAVQVTMRVIGAPRPEDAHDEPLAAPPDRPGTAYLERRRRVIAPAIPGWDELGASLRAHVRAERTQRGDPRASERWRAYHLVATSALDAYRAEAALLRERAPELAFGEPSPPWAFVPEELG